MATAAPTRAAAMKVYLIFAVGVCLLVGNKRLFLRRRKG
jgi:hypothetical protein